ncbi:MAG: hypothetical protein KG028_13690 [Actinobacteria bacterium]|nr:hypothetical protein [Actinomycetota bacterium]
MTYIDFRGTFRIQWADGSSGKTRFLGLEPDKRRLWLVPTNSSFRSPHVTGSTRSRELNLDEVTDIWRRPPRLLEKRSQLVLEFQVHEKSTPARLRISEPKRQGRLDEVEQAIRSAWGGWRPEVLEDDWDDDDWAETSGADESDESDE